MRRPSSRPSSNPGYELILRRWLAWRKGHEDEGMGSVLVPPDELARMEAAEDPAEIRAIVEQIVLADRRQKEEEGR